MVTRVNSGDRRHPCDRAPTPPILGAIPGIACPFSNSKFPAADLMFLQALAAKEAVRGRRFCGEHRFPSRSYWGGELYYGAHHSAQVQCNLREIQAFAAIAQVLVCDCRSSRPGKETCGLPPSPGNTT